jgi:hypothetical protein
MRALRVCICLFALMNSPASLATQPLSPSQSPSTGSQQAKPPKSNTQPPAPGASSQPPAKQQTQDQKVAAFQSRLAKIFDPANVDLSDYVPCHFTVSELLQLRPAPPTPRLTGEEAEALKEQVETEALAQEESGFLDHDSQVDFVTNVAASDLEGLTPSAALATIVALFRSADKAGEARRNPSAIISIYENNPLQGLAVLASIAPDSGPIGTGWANSVSQQAYELGVMTGLHRGLTNSQAEDLFQSFASADFRNDVAALPPKEALKKVNDQTKSILDEGNTELSTLQNKVAKLRSLGFDGGTAAVPLEKATKASADANAAVAAAQQAYQAIANVERQAHEQLDMTQSRAQQADTDVQAAGPDPKAIQALADNQQKARAELATAQQNFNTTHKQLLDAMQDVNQKTKADEAAGKALEEAKKNEQDVANAPQDLKNAQKSVASASDTLKVVGGASQPVPTGAAAQAIVNIARSTIEAFKRPPDIGCAMSILSWNETRYEYGRLLANEYVGVQVVVRNLSETQEFAMHDSAFAVDADLTGRKGRFFSGRDKLILRGMSAADADFSPRNVVVHMMESVGTIMSAVIPIAGVSFGSAASVYNTGFLEGLHKTWADHNTDHLNLLNDTAFSSATAYKTVVPKSGSVMFVMFIPSKQFEQGWWTQQCAQTISNGILLNSDDPDGSRAEAERQARTASGLDTISAPKPVRTEDQIGIDLERARAACKFGGGEATQDSGTSTIPSGSSSPTKPFKAIPYKNWSGNALATFRELAFTIVSGIHLNEASQTKPATSAVDCPEDTQGNIDFSKQSGGVLSCDIKGQNLDKVQKLRLRNSSDATDSKVAEGDVTVSGDPTAAKVALPLSQIGPLDGAAYKTFTVDKNGVEGTGGQTLHFARTPFIAPPTPNPVSIDLGKDLDPKSHTKTIELSGYHLDKVSGIHLEGGDSPVIKLDFIIDKPSISKASFVFDGTKSQSDVEKATKPFKLNMTLNTTDKANPTVPSLTTVSISGSIQPAVASPVPANSGGAVGESGAADGAAPAAPSKKAPSKPQKPASSP